MKRFWDHATAEPVENGFAIHLDGKPMRLPSARILVVRSPDLAAAIATEWAEAGGGKGNEMSFADTPLTRLAGTAKERIAREKADKKYLDDASTLYAQMLLAQTENYMVAVWRVKTQKKAPAAAGKK